MSRPAPTRAGSRRSEPARTGVRRVSPVLLLPLGAVLLALVVAFVPADEPPASAPRPVPVLDTAYACAGAPDVATGQVRAGDAAQVTASGADGVVSDDVPDVTDPGAWVRSELADAGDDVDALVVRQQGESSGAVGFVSGVLSDDDGDGLVVGPCSGVVDDAWWVGLGSGGRHQSRLVLTNLGDTPAVADLALWTPEGPVEGVDDQGIVVDAGQSRTVDLSDVAAGEPDLAVHLERRRGALAATAVDTATGASAGSEIVDPVSSASRDVVVGGLPEGDRGRTLQVLNPGEETARVQVEVLGPDGPFAPEGLDEISVPAGGTTSVEVPDSAGSDPVALRLAATRPVVAGVSVSASGDDTARMEGVGAWEGDAVVPLGGDLETPELLLTAPDGARRVVVEAHGADLGVLAEAEVDVPEGSTVGVDLADVLDLGDAAYVVVRSEGGVVGAAQYADGDRTASLALTAAPTEVVAPRVRLAP